MFSCFGLREGRLKVRPSNETLRPNDELTWDGEMHACVSRKVSAAVAARQAVTYGMSAERLPRQCCRFTSLIKAEWWHHYRSGAAPPSLGPGDSWVRLGRWVRNKSAPAVATGLLPPRARRSGGRRHGGGHGGHARAGTSAPAQAQERWGGVLWQRP